MSKSGPVVWEAAPSCHSSLAELIDGSSMQSPRETRAAAPIKTTSRELLSQLRRHQAFWRDSGPTLRDCLEDAVLWTPL